jgi:hypothetical protein
MYEKEAHKTSLTPIRFGIFRLFFNQCRNVSDNVVFVFQLNTITKTCHSNSSAHTRQRREAYDLDCAFGILLPLCTIDHVCV